MTSISEYDNSSTKREDINLIVYDGAPAHRQVENYLSSKYESYES